MMEAFMTISNLVVLACVVHLVFFKRGRDAPVHDHSDHSVHYHGLAAEEVSKDHEEANE